MNKRFVGEVTRWEYQNIRNSVRFVGAIYDTSKRRADTGDMAKDFRFVEFLAAASNRTRANAVLCERLSELNVGSS